MQQKTVRGVQVEAARKYVGAGVKRKEDARLLCGKGSFVDDITVPGMLHIAILRSPYAHARINRVDVSGALQVPGVVAAYSGKDIPVKLPMAYEKTIPGNTKKIATHYCLAIDKVRYVGEPVAAVVAMDRYVAHDALESIDVDYEALTPVVDPEKAMKPDSPQIYEDWGDNILQTYKLHGGNIETAFKEADGVVKEKIVEHRYTGMPLETRGYAASYDKATGRMTYWASTQVPHILRTILSFATGIPEPLIRVITQDVGGGFGPKHPVCPEEIIVALVSRMLDRPVKWIETRREHMMASHHARDQIHYVEVPYKKDGTILGIKDKMIVDFGVCHPTAGVGSNIVTVQYIPGPYKIPNYKMDMYSVATNKGPYGAYRGFGKADSCYVYERIIDIVAKELKMSRVEIRLKNFIQPNEFPYKTASGANYDSGDYPTCFKKALELAQYDGLKAEQSRLRKQGKFMGIGIAFMLEPAGHVSPESLYAGYESATVRVVPTGKVMVLSGLVSPGTGQETTIAQVVADEIGADLDDVVVKEGDTDVCPYGLGNWSSRGVVVGVPAAMLAARQIRDKILTIAAHALGVGVSELAIERSNIYVRDKPSMSISLAEVAKLAYYPLQLPPGLSPGLDATSYYTTPNIRYTPDEQGRVNVYPEYAYAAHVVSCEVDPESGIVKLLKWVIVTDCGTVINPVVLDGQNHGAVAQAIGGALLEELVYDDNGQLLASSFMDYLMPTAEVVPPMVVDHMSTPSPFNPGGFKGGGEAGTIGGPPAVVSAIEDALAPFDVNIREIPVTPERLWRLLSSAISP